MGLVFPPIFVMLNQEVVAQWQTVAAIGPDVVAALCALRTAASFATDDSLFLATRSYRRLRRRHRRLAIRLRHRCSYRQCRSEAKSLLITPQSLAKMLRLSTNKLTLDLVDHMALFRRQRATAAVGLPLPVWKSSTTGGIGSTFVSRSHFRIVAALVRAHFDRPTCHSAHNTFFRRDNAARFRTSVCGTP